MMRKAEQTVITGLEVKNYRSLGDIRISLEPLTVLAGPNGAGKSNVIDALRFVRDALKLGIKEAVRMRGGKHRIRHDRLSRFSDIAIRLCFSGPAVAGEYGFVLERENLKITAEKCSVTPAGKAEPIGFEIRDGKLVSAKSGGDFDLPSDYTGTGETLRLPGLRTFFPALDAAYQFLSAMMFYNIPPEKLRAPQPESEAFPLDEQGGNLNSVLNAFKEKHPTESDNLLKALKTTIPELQAYSVASAGHYRITRLHYRYGKAEAVFELAQESEGTLRLLSVLTALCQPLLSPMTLEEPELNLHPSASAILGDILQESALTRQVLITTHSPDLTDSFPPHLLRVVEKTDGITRVGPLSKSQSDAVTEGLFTPGELMRIHGLERDSEN